MLAYIYAPFVKFRAYKSVAIMPRVCLTNYFVRIRSPPLPRGGSQKCEPSCPPARSSLVFFVYSSLLLPSMMLYIHVGVVEIRGTAKSFAFRGKLSKFLIDSANTNSGKKKSIFVIHLLGGFMFYLKDKSHTITIRLSSAEYNRLRTFCTRGNFSISDVIRILINSLGDSK